MIRRRFFVVDAAGGAAVVDIPDDVWAGFDVLLADGMPHDMAADMLWAANRSGRDALKFAEHLVMLRKAAREPATSPVRRSSNRGSDT